MLHDLVEIVRDYLIESITTYYDTGEIHEEYMKIACKIHGAYYVWYPDGSPQRLVKYKNGKEHGLLLGYCSLELA
jgi:antitoxin component YwqK of YwqJK toxin-antitoxin module